MSLFKLRNGQCNFRYEGETIQRKQTYASDHPVVKAMPGRFFIVKEEPYEKGSITDSQPTFTIEAVENFAAEVEEGEDEE